MSPDLIDLNLTEGSGWVIDESASTAERTVLYYTRALAPGESTPDLSDTLRIDPAVLTKVTETVTEDENGYKTIETSYDYDAISSGLKQRRTQSRPTMRKTPSRVHGAWM